MDNYAGLWIRGGALFIDLLITHMIPIIIVISLILLPLWLNTQPIIEKEYFNPLRIMLPWFMLVLSAIYFPLCIMSSQQATVGMRLLKLKIVRAETGEKLSPKDAVLRTMPLLFLLFINQIDHLIPSYLWDMLFIKIVVYLIWVPMVISFLVAAFDSEKRTLWDRVYSTRVIRAYTRHSI